MKKITGAVAGLAMLVVMAGPASAATPKAHTAKSHAPIAAKAARCSHRKGAQNKCVSKRMHATSTKKTTPTTSKKK